ncbi:hypothetical protein CL645_01505 [bacterium]|nr:hypothetical protein [bacterium]|tara:strand:- start:1496 stop:2722 length:1227 start_codon:yes stop_codon:yes gene_type:complete
MIVENLKFAMRAIFSKPLRSILTLIGITFGVASVVIVTGVGEGFKKNFEDSMAGLGTNLLVVWPGRDYDSSIETRKKVQPLTIEDAEEIEKLPHVNFAAPEVGAREIARVGNRNLNVDVRGVTPAYSSVRSYEIDKGRFLSPLDIEGKKRVTVIGPGLWKKLLPGQDPIGEKIILGGVSFEVIGVLSAKEGGGRGDDGFSSADEISLIPITTAKSFFSGGKGVSTINVEAKSLKDIALTEQEITELLRKRHNIKFSEGNDFGIFNSGEIVTTVSGFINGFNMFLLAIGSISLLIGGIGIMNIMLVTVAERTSEIGLRKALGALNRDIQIQFLIESISLAFMGGLLGMLLGYGAISGIGRIPDFPGEPIFNVQVFIISASVSMAIGLVFGLIPANQASKLDPIVALRRD